jgi:hypothetical protein
VKDDKMREQYGRMNELARSGRKKEGGKGNEVWLAVSQVFYVWWRERSV